MKLKSLSSNNIFSTTSACSGKSCRTVMSIPTIFSPIRGVLVSVNRNYKIIIFRKYQQEVLICLDHIAKYHIFFSIFRFLSIRDSQALPNYHEVFYAVLLHFYTFDKHCSLIIRHAVVLDVNLIRTFLVHIVMSAVIDKATWL